MNKEFMKNKKGDIPVTILVIGVFVICGLAILSFYISDRGVRSGFDSLETIQEITIEAEKISFYEKVGLSQEEIKDIIEIEGIIKIEEDEQGRKYLYIEQNKISVRYNLP